MCRINPEIVEFLCQAVRVRGMSKFLSHDAIAKGTFNTGWSSGINTLESWKDELTNAEDLAQVSWTDCIS